MKMKQHIFEFSANGALHEGWGAGAITVAVGGSYRKETIHQIVRDPGNLTSDHTLGPARTAFPVPCADRQQATRPVCAVCLRRATAPTLSLPAIRN